MKIYTISNDFNVSNGANVEKVTLGNGSSFPALVIGEEGRGRMRGILPVRLAAHNQSYYEKGEKITLLSAAISHSLKGNVRLNEENDLNSEGVIIVFRTPIGFRGSNNHIFPANAKIISCGEIAQGEAGRMGSGNQYIAIIPFGEVVKINIGGRRYGSPTDYIIHITSDGVTALSEAEDALLEGGY